MSANILLISAKIIKDRTTVHGNLDDSLILPDIKFAQDAFIKPVLGTALYEKLQSLVSDNTISTSPNADYKLLLDEYLIDALIYFTLAELPVGISYQFWNKGVVRKQGQDTEVPTMAELMDISNRFKSRGEYYANRMKLFIIDQNSRLSKYPEYTNPGNRVDTITPEQRNFTMPVWLEDPEGRDNPWCNRGGFNGEPYKP